MDLQTRDITTLRALQGALKRWVDLFLSDPANQALGLTQILDNQIIELRRVRWYSLDMADAEKLWNDYVYDDDQSAEVRESLLDFYLNGASFLWLETPVPSQHRITFMEHLVDSLTWVNRGSLVPEAIREYTVGAGTLSKILDGNHWILFMILLSLTSID